MSESSAIAVNELEESSANEELKYTVIEVTKSEGPGGAEGDDWYRYIIHNPGSPITGYRRGKKKEIMAYLQQCTAQLDERISPRKSKRR